MDLFISWKDSQKATDRFWTMRNKFHCEQKLQKDKFILKLMKNPSEIVGCQYDANVKLTMPLQTVIANVETNQCNELGIGYVDRTNAGYINLSTQSQPNKSNSTTHDTLAYVYLGIYTQRDYKVSNEDNFTRMFALM